MGEINTPKNRTPNHELMFLVNYYMWGKPKDKRDAEMKYAFKVARRSGYDVAIKRYLRLIG